MRDRAIGKPHRRGMMTDRQAIELDLDEGDFINLEILGDIALDERDQKLSDGYRWLAKHKRVPYFGFVRHQDLVYCWAIHPSDDIEDSSERTNTISRTHLPKSIWNGIINDPANSVFKTKSAAYRWAAERVGEWLHRNRSKAKASDSDTPQPVLSHAQNPSEQP